MQSRSPERTVAALLQRNGASHPERPALLAPGREPFSWSELLAQTERFGRALADAGIARSDGVAVLLPNGPEMAATFLAVASAATCAPLNPAYTEKELEFYLSDLRPAAIVVDRSETSAAIRAVAERRGTRIIEVSATPGGPAGLLDLDLGTSSGGRGSAGAADAEDVALVLHTSGTTSRPKIVPLSHGNLVASADNVARTLELGPHDRCLNVMPLFHIHGIVAALLGTTAAGGSIVCTSGFAHASFLSTLEHLGPSWYTAVPTIHQAVLKAAEPHDQVSHSLRFIRSSSASLPPQVMRRLEERFGVPVVEAYGMTEAAHQISSNPLPPATRRPGTVGPAAGPEVRILTPDGFGDVGEVGEIVIRGENVTVGYRDNPEANASAFTEDGWFRTGDQGSVDADGHITITGRLKEIINRGGEKISPREIDEALLEHPDVVQAVAFAVEHPTLGEEVGAAVVLRPGSELTEEGVRALAAQRLAPFKVPRVITVVDEIPKGATGKIQRIGMAERLGLHGATAAPTPRATRAERPSPLESALRSVWTDLLDLESVGLDDDFFLVGGDSLAATELMMIVSEVTGVDLTLQDLFEGPLTVRRLAATVERVRSRPALDEAASAADDRPGADGPLTFAQERMWLAAQMAGDDVDPYEEVILLRIRGPLDHDALGVALEHLVERHPALRTVFPTVEALPVQRVLAPAPVPVDSVDLRSRSDRDAVLEEFRTPGGRLGPLGEGPLFAARLALVRDGEHLLALDVHHIVCDGWSRGIIAGDLARLLSAGAPGAAGPPPAITPVDVARRERADPGRLEDGLRWWAEHLDGAPLVLELPTDHPRPARRRHRGARYTTVIDAGPSARLLAAGRDRSCTPFMTLHACLAEVLRRFTGESDLVVGTPVAGRPRADMRSVVGSFINTIPIRTTVDEALPFAENLDRIRTAVLESLAHQDVPFGAIVDRLQPPRQLSHPPLVQVLYQWRNLPGAEAEDRSAIRIDEVAPVQVPAKVDLAVDAELAADGRIVVTFDYDRDLFREDTVELFAEHLTAVAHAVSDDPLTPLRQAGTTAGSPLPAARGERTAEATTLHRLFLQSAERHADGVAADEDGRPVTFAQLRDRSGSLAAALHERGVRRGDRVAVLVERSAALVTASLAVLRSGATCVPIDPGHPPDHIRSLLERCAVAAVVVSGRTRALAPEGMEVVPVEEGSAGSSSPPPDDARPGDAAYILFTSGSTGAPKGVVLSHAGLANHAEAAVRLYALTPSDRVLQMASPASDISLEEIHATLAAGATVVPRTEDVPVAGPAFGRWLDDARISVLDLPTAVWHAWTDDLSEFGVGTTPSALRLVIVGGQQAERSAYERWRSCVGDQVRWINTYGPTETSIIVAAWEPTPDQQVPPRLPIGRPVAGAHLHVLDPSGRPVPERLPGELHIGGPGLAVGYLDDPETTERSFVHHPELGARLYRTGDRVRRTAAGDLEFLGRLDDQVKVHGYRVDPGEVEAQLASLPDVTGAVVTADAGTNGDTRLLAHVTVRDRQITAQAIDAALRARVPAHLVPALRVVDRIALTSGGKPDRRVVVESFSPRPARAASPTEEQVRQVWSRLLGTEIGIDDDFFAAGGHSLLAARMAVRVHEALGVDVPMALVFEHPTVADFTAALLGQAPQGGASASEVPGPAPLRPAQRRLWILHRANPLDPSYNVPLVLALRGDLDLDALQWAIDAVVERHEPLRAVFPEVDGIPVQVVQPARSRPMTLIDLQADPAAEARAGDHVAAEVATPFDLLRSEPLRATVIRIAPLHSVLVLVTHHIVTDAESAVVLTQDLASLYGQARTGVPADLPPGTRVPTATADVATQEDARASGSWWREELVGVERSDVLSDAVSLATGRGRAGVLRVRFDTQVVHSITSLAREAGVTPFVVQLAAVVCLLRRVTGRSDIVVGTVSSNRGTRGAERAVGFFVDTLPLRVRGGPRDTLRTLLVEVSRALRSAQQHADLSFDEIVQAVNPPRDVSRHPIFDVIVSQQAARQGDIEFPGLDVELLPVDPPAAQLDLAFQWVARGSQLSCTLRYDSSRFEAETVDALGRLLRELLVGATRQPDWPLTQLEVLTAAEREAVESWAETITPAGGTSITAMFDLRATGAPDAVAIAHGTVRRTYRDLQDRAGRVGAELRRNGVGPGAVVALVGPRSVELVEGMLGILYAGGAYLPIDPSDPEERVRFLMEDAGAEIALVTPAARGWSAPEGRTRLDVDALAQRPRIDEHEVNATDPGDAAYVLYTSGSTGRPKAVVVEHHAVVELVVDASYVDIGREDVVGCAANPSFDATTFEVWGALLNGATLAILDQDDVLRPDELAEVLRRDGVTILFVTTALFSLVSAHRPDAFSTLDTLLFGGERCDPSDVAHVLRHGPPRRLLHVYGPTECVTFTTWHLVTEVEPARPVPIGRPVTGNSVRIVDTDLRDVPVGLVGELLVGGPKLARGYLAGPDDERFVQHPRTGERMYRTGDLGRHRSDGSIEFRGRLDDQVKIRGFRIEPGEIESVLREHDDVRQAVVVPHGRADDLELRAYAVVGRGSPCVAADLREWLRSRLPGHLVPAHVVVVYELPLSANGKVDRDRLPAPAPTPGGESPTTPTERAVHEIWCAVLEQPHAAGVTDDFFDVGGHSLLAVRLLAEIEAELGVRLPLSVFFGQRTIRALAEAIDRGVRDTAGVIVPIQPLGDREPLWLMKATEGALLAARNYLTDLGDDQPVIGVWDPTLRADDERRPRSVERMADSCLAAIRSVQPAGPYHLCGHSFGGLVAYEVAQRLAAEGEDVRLLVLLDTFCPSLYRRGERGRRALRLVRHAELSVLRDAVRRRRERLLRRAPKRAGRPADGRRATEEDQVWTRREAAAARARAYRPAPSSVPVTIFATSPSVEWCGHEALGWEALLVSGRRVVRCPGGHSSMLREPHVSAVARALADALEASRGER